MQPFWASDRQMQAQTGQRTTKGQRNHRPSGSLPQMSTWGPAHTDPEYLCTVSMVLSLSGFRPLSSHFGPRLVQAKFSQS